MAKKVLDLNIKHPIAAQESPGGKIGVIALHEKIRKPIIGVSYYVVEKDDLCACITDLRDDAYSSLMLSFPNEGRLGIYNYDLAIFDYDGRTIRFKNKETEKLAIIQSSEIYYLMVEAIKQSCLADNNISSYKLRNILEESYKTMKDNRKKKIKKGKTLIIHEKLVNYGDEENGQSESVITYIEQGTVSSHLDKIGGLTQELLSYQNDHITRVIFSDKYQQVVITLDDNKSYSLALKGESYDKIRLNI